MPVDSLTVTVIVVDVPPFRLICGGRGWVVFCDYSSIEAICVKRFGYFQCMRSRPLAGGWGSVGPVVVCRKGVMALVRWRVHLGVGLACGGT